MKKRIFSFILTLAVLLTAPFIHCFAEAIPQTATEFEQTVMTITDPEIVSKNYESLAASESLFLDSGYLIGNEYKYRKPNDASLFETDTATKSIKASACTDEFGNLWHPVRAIISYADGSETVTLTEGKGGFTYDGSEYTVSVVYEMYLSSGSEIQRILINAAYYLVRAISNASKIDESILEIELAASNTASLSSNENEALRSAMAPETRSALERLNSQLGSDRDGDGEPDGMLEISELLELYESAQSKTGYLMTHGKALGTEARAFFESISLIANDSGLLNTIETIGLADPERADKLEEALRCFRDLAEAIEGPALDNWTALDRSVFRDGMTADDYEDVDMLLQEVVDEYEREERTLEPHVEEIKDLLWADSAVISSSVQRRTLTVTVGVNAISPMSFDSAETVSLGSESIELVFDKGTSAADIYADLELLGTESELLGRFGQIYEINETNYERTSNSIPDVLNEDATYYVEYNPRSFSVTYDYDPDAAGLLPFGYNMTLAPSETAGKIFEYQINGFSYRQGEIFTVRGDTVVSRNEISPTGTNRLNVIVSDIYGDLLTPEEKAILSSTALDGKVYNIVSPTDADELVKITVTGPGHYHVTADTLPSGIEGMIWYPVSAKTVRPNGSVISSFSMENGEADFSTDESYDKVEVLYKLDVNEEHITKIGVLDLPDKLAKQAESDIANMDLLGSIYSLLSQFDSSMIGRIGIVARNLSEESQAAVKDLTANCIDKTTNSLYIYDQLKAYSEEGLAYLYKDGNISKIKTQIDYVRTDFRIIYEDPKFRELLVELIDEETADNYCRRLADILGVLDKIELSPANENILPDDNGYDSLIAAIEAAIGHTSDHSDAEDRQLYIKTTVSATAPDKASITLTVCMSDGKGNITASVSDKSIYPLGTEMTSGDVAALNDIALSLAVKLGVDTWHYTQHGLIDIAPGTLIEADYHFTINWKPNVYTVIITDENGQPVGELRFSYDFPTVMLPAPEDAREIYEYRIGEETVLVRGSAKKYRFVSVDETLFPEGVCTVIRTGTDSYSDYIVALVNELNKSSIESGMKFTKDGYVCPDISFLPAKDPDGNMAIIMRGPFLKDSRIVNLIPGIASALFGSPFDNIAVCDMYLREGSELSMDSLINALFCTGLSIDKFCEAVDENGNVIESEFPEELTVIGEDAENKILVLGDGQAVADTDKFGALISTLGVKFFTGYDDPGTEVRLYLTLEDHGQKTEELADQRKTLISLKETIDFSLSDGRINITNEFSDGFYQMFMSCMILLGNADISSMDEIDSITAMHFFIDVLRPLLANDSFTGKTLENTFSRVGYSSGLAEIEKHFTIFRDLLGEMILHGTFTEESGEGGKYSAVLLYDVNNLLDSMGIDGLLANVIREKDTGIRIPISVDMTNSSTEYQAVIISPSQNGPFEFDFIKDLPAELPAISAGSNIILLKDIETDLIIGKEISIDLNGKNILGSIIGDKNKTVSIGDSTRETLKCGSVRGEMIGKFAINGGRYVADVSDWLDEEYVVEDGLVHSRFYTVDVSEDGQLNIRIVEDFLNSETSLEETMQIILTQALRKMLMDHLTDPEMTINGRQIYSISFDDAFGLFSNKNNDDYGRIFEGFDCENTSAFMNGILADVFDYKNVAAKIRAGKPISVFEYTTKDWKLETELMGEGSDNYIAFNVSPGNVNGGRSVRMYMQTADNEAMATLFDDLGELMTAGIELDIREISGKDGKIVLDSDGTISLSADFSSDPSYAVVMALLIADQTNDAGLKNKMVSAIKKYYSEDSTDDIKAAIDGLTVGQVFGTLKNSYKSSDLTRIINELGIVETVGDDLDDLQHVFNIMLSSVIPLFGRMEISGSEKLFKSLEMYGSYGLYFRNTTSKFENYSKYGELTVGYNIRFDSVRILAKFFDYKITVISQDGYALYSGSDADAAFDAVEEWCTIRIRKNLTLNTNVDIPFAVTVSGADKLKFGDITITLTMPKSSLTSDVQLSWELFRSGDEKFIVNESAGVDKYVYSLQVSPTSGKFAVAVISANGNFIYTGNNAVAAFAAATEGCRITVYESLTLTDSVYVGASISIVGVKYINFGRSSIVLTGSNTVLTVDKKLSDPMLTSGSFSYQVYETKADNKYIYSLLAITPVLSAPTVKYNDAGNIRGALVDNENKYIYIDGNPLGTTVGFFRSSLNFTSSNSTNTSVSIISAGVPAKDDDLIRTGDKMTAVASNDSDKTDSRTYTILVLGDTNSNGRIDSGDALRMMLHYMEYKLISGAELAAADVNRNGRVDSGDAVKNSTKYTYMWDNGSYRSALR